MRFLWVPILAAAVLGWPAPPAEAQTKQASGAVTAVTDSSLTVRVSNNEMKFSIDNTTIVEAQGAGRATRDAQSKGQPGIKITSVVKPGAGVVVTYREVKGTLLATEVQIVPAAAAGATAAPAAGAGAPASQTANGRVKTVTDTSLVVTDSGKDLTFMVDATTRVVAKGAGTATQAAGGKIPFSKLVGVGDTVSVSYEGAAPKMRATEVRITLNADRAPTPTGK
ncbi:MAG TPA: DUF5666 domain-containing protein [Vicinamibacterales bacterium]|nr:DUF5666 domain-containing protein [Vicinamibacterales bacterium]